MLAVWSIRNGLDCQTCTPQLRAFRGHDEDTETRTILGYRVRRCPLLSMTPTHSAYLQAYSDYQKGILPNPGGALQQPMKFFSVMNLIDKIQDMIDKEEK